MPKYTPSSPMTPTDELAYGQEVFGQLNRLIALTKGQHDRVLVLSLASFAEECLGRLLASFFREVKASKELLEGFNAPLGTFSARIKMCHAAGLLTDRQYHDLDLVRKIRNRFAHSWDEMSFSDESIRSWTDSLNKPRLGSLLTEPIEEKFKSVMLILLIEFETLQHEIQLKEKRLPSIAMQFGKATT